MAFKFNPFTGSLDFAGSGVTLGAAAVGFTPNRIQFVDASGNQAESATFIRESDGQQAFFASSPLYALYSIEDSIDAVVIISTEPGPAGMVTLVFDGVTSVDDVVAAWNGSNTPILNVGGDGSIIPDAQTITLGGGTEAALVTGGNVAGSPVLPGGFQGSGMVYTDEAGNSAFGAVGNAGALLGESRTAFIAGVLGSEISAFVATGPAMQVINTDQATYSSNIELSSQGASLSYKGIDIGVDSTGPYYRNSDGGNVYLPLSAPNLGDQVYVSNISGSDVTLDYAASSGFKTLDASHILVGNNNGDGTAVDAGNNYIIDLTNRIVSLGDGYATLRIDGSAQIAMLYAPTGGVSIGDPKNAGGSFRLNVLNGPASERCMNGIGVFAEPGAAVQIDSAGVSGLNDMSLGGKYTATSGHSYSVTMIANNMLWISFSVATGTFSPGDGIVSDTNPADTATIVDVSQVGDKGYLYATFTGAWNSPSPVSITNTTSLFTADVKEIEVDNDIYEVQKDATIFPFWPTGLAGVVDGLSVGWSAFTGHTIGDVWTFAPNVGQVEFFRFDGIRNRLTIGADEYQGRPDWAVNPKGFKVQYNATNSWIEMGGAAAGGALNIGSFSDQDSLVFFNRTTNAQYLNVNYVDGIYSLGDLSGSLNSSKIQIDDFNTTISASIGGFTLLQIDLNDGVTINNTAGTPFIVSDDNRINDTNGNTVCNFSESNTRRFYSANGNPGFELSNSQFNVSQPFRSAQTSQFIGNASFLADVAVNKTITPGGTTGAQVINKTAGSVNFAAAATSLVVTNNLVTANSVIIVSVASDDATMTSVKAVPGSGSFAIYPNAAPTGETRVNFVVLN